VKLGCKYGRRRDLEVVDNSADCIGAGCLLGRSPSNNLHGRLAFGGMVCWRLFMIPLFGMEAFELFVPLISIILATSVL